MKSITVNICSYNSLLKDYSIFLKAQRNRKFRFSLALGGIVVGLLILCVLIFDYPFDYPHLKNGSEERIHSWVNVLMVVALVLFLGVSGFYLGARKEETRIQLELASIVEQASQFAEHCISEENYGGPFFEFDVRLREAEALLGGFDHRQWKLIKKGPKFNLTRLATF